MGVSMLSLFESNRDADNIAVYLLASKLTEQSIARIREIANEYGRSLLVLDVSDSLHNMAEHYGLQSYGQMGSLAAYSRIFMADILPSELTRVLYLDCDTIVLSNLTDLISMELGQHACAMALDTVSPRFKQHVGLEAGHNYFNSGVLLANLTYWRTHSVSHKLWEYFKMGDMSLPDQNAINSVLSQEILILPIRYNATSRLLSISAKSLQRLCRGGHFYDCAEITEAQNDPAIIHYVSDALGRPWQQNCQLPFASFWNDAFCKSPWEGIYKKSTLSTSLILLIERTIHIYFGSRSRVEFLIAWENLRYFWNKLLTKSRLIKFLAR